MVQSMLKAAAHVSTPTFVLMKTTDTIPLEVKQLETQNW